MFRQDDGLSSNYNAQPSTQLMLYHLMSKGYSNAVAHVSEAAAVQQEDNAVAAQQVVSAPATQQPTPEELQRQAEEEKRQQEEQQREWIKYQAYLITQEEQNEKMRCKNFDDHVFLIANGQGQSFEYLKSRLGALMPIVEPIERFAGSFRRGLPKRSPQYGGESLFDVILQNTNLTSANKFELLAMLFDLGYYPFYMTLLVNPLIQYLLQDDTFNVFLEHLYSWCLRDRKLDLEPFVEQAIWKKLIGLNKGCQIFDALLEASRNNSRRVFDYIDVWMSQLESPDEIINRVKYIEQAIDSLQLAKYLPDIYKIAKVRVFDIVIDKISENREQYNEYLRAPDPEGVLTRSLNFLNTHRNSFFWGGFGSTKSKSIYSMLQTDVDLARQMHDKEKIKFREELNAKLGEDQQEKRSMLSYFKF